MLMGLGIKSLLNGLVIGLGSGSSVGGFTFSWLSKSRLASLRRSACAGCGHCYLCDVHRTIECALGLPVLKIACSGRRCV